MLENRKGIFPTLLWGLAKRKNNSLKDMKPFGILDQREIQHCKFTVVFFGGFIIGFCGFDFIVEKSNGFAFAIMGYLNVPFLCSFLPAHSFIF